MKKFTTILILITFATSYAQQETLPVELVYFYGEVKGDTVNLFWGTATEVNNVGFNVEKKKDGETEWATIGFVIGAGTSNSPKHYDFVDTDISEIGTYFYRLKQLDNDGDFEYSDEISLNIITSVNKKELLIEDKTLKLYQNFPNPFNPSTQISFYLPQNDYVQLRVYNLLGESVAEIYKGELNAGYHKILFEPVGLASGIYIYTITTDSFSDSKKLTLKK